MARVGEFVGVMALTLVCGLSGSVAVASPTAARASVRVGTDVWPALSPLTLPPVVAEYGSIMTVGTDVRFGLGVDVHTDANRRYSMLVTVDSARYYSNVSVPIEVTRLYPIGSHFSWTTGGGFGVGWQQYSGYSQERLSILSVPFRASLGAEVGGAVAAVSVRGFIGYDVPLAHWYTTAGGLSEIPGVGLYPSVGVDLTVHVGRVKL